MQSKLNVDQAGPAIEDVLASLRRLRVQHVMYEYTLQDAIAKQLAADGISYQKEYRLGPHNRIDFLLPGGIGIEAKKGKWDSGRVAEQVERYCRFETISQLVLVIERCVFWHDRSTGGKPVHYIALNKLWGIAL